MSRMIDSLGLDGRKVRSLEALHRKAHDPFRSTKATVSEAQWNALQDACIAAIKAGKATPEFLAHAKQLGLNTTV